MIDLSGQHVHVVGGSRGIGEAAARMAATAGAAVSLVYRQDAERAKAVVEDITNMGGRSAAYQADAAAEGALALALDDAVSNLGPLNGLVVSAGIYADTWHSRIDDLTAAEWDKVLGVNLRGTFLSVQAAARHMRAAGGGSIVIYTSTAGQSGGANNSPYATSKGAQITFMRSAAKELASDGIRVNCIAPAWTESDTATPLMDSLGRGGVLTGCPLGRTGTPEDIAGPTCFLLSDLASYMTGSTVTVDGGQGMRG